MAGSLLQGWELNGAFGVCGVQSCWLCNNIPQILSRQQASICVLIHVEYLQMHLLIIYFHPHHKKAKGSGKH